MRNFTRLLTAACLTLALNSAWAAQPSAPGAKLHFIGLIDGATVSSPLDLTFASEGMDIVPAGTDKPHSGHHHLLIDTGLPALDQPIPKDANHLHFGKGQTETKLELSPGTHTLQLILGDKDHIPHQPPVVSEKITITVK